MALILLGAECLGFHLEDSPPELPGTVLLHQLFSVASHSCKFADLSSPLLLCITVGLSPLHFFAVI